MDARFQDILEKFEARIRDAELRLTGRATDRAAAALREQVRFMEAEAASNAGLAGQLDALRREKQELAKAKDEETSRLYFELERTRKENNFLRHEIAKMRMERRRLHVLEAASDR